MADFLYDSNQIVTLFQPNAKIVDPLCTFLFSIIVVFTTVRLIKQSLRVIMDAAPANVDVKRLTTELACLPGVLSVHHLTVWSVTVDWTVMAVHLIIGKCVKNIMHSLFFLYSFLCRLTVKFGKSSTQCYRNGSIRFWH